MGLDNPLAAKFGKKIGTYPGICIAKNDRNLLPVTKNTLTSVEADLKMFSFCVLRYIALLILGTLFMKAAIEVRTN